MDFIEVNRTVLDAERAALDAFGQAAAMEARLCQPSCDKPPTIATTSPELGHVQANELSSTLGNSA
jgi:hypothetical protein